eukprot:SAG11_NODE_334_length_10569_cov_9.662082_3_plen_253_part_00
MDEDDDDDDDDDDYNDQDEDEDYEEDNEEDNDDGNTEDNGDDGDNEHEDSEQEEGDEDDGDVVALAAAAGASLGLVAGALKGQSTPKKKQKEMVQMGQTTLASLTAPPPAEAQLATASTTVQRQFVVNLQTTLDSMNSATVAMQALLDSEMARTISVDTGCQYGGKGDFKLAHLELTISGQLTVKSLDAKKPEPLVTVKVADCVFEPPKKSRKEYPNAVVLRRGAGKAELKLVLGFRSLGEYGKWLVALCAE